jgi:hypothetical protein
LEYATLGWNVVEIGFLVAAAVSARSVALAGFALDSCIEIFASVVVVWQLKGSAHHDRERRAVRLIDSAWDPRRLRTLEVRMEHGISPVAEAVSALSYASARCGWPRT